MRTSTSRAPSPVPARRTRTAGAVAIAAATGILIAGGSPAAAVPGAVPASAEASAAKASVPIKENKYSPETMTVKLGSTVTWTNYDADPHTVSTTTAPAAFDSGVFKQGQSYTYTFETPGTYDYYCAVHPEMVANIIVLDKDGKQVAPPAEPEQPANPLASLLGGLLPKAPEHTMNPGPNPSPESSNGHSGHSTPSSETSSSSSPSAYPYAAAPDPVSGAVDPFMLHMEAAHFSRGAGQQVQDMAEFDYWMLTHEALFRQMLEYEVGKSSVLGTTPVTDVFMQHMDATHWNQSPMQQASAIADFDSWNKSHVAMFRLMFDPFVGKSSALGTTPMTRMFMQHMDAAHWNESLNGQATAITDDGPSWVASHQAMTQAMLGDSSTLGGGTKPGSK